MPNLFSLLRGKRVCRALFLTLLVCLDHDRSFDVDAEELEALDQLYFSPVDVNGGALGPLFPLVHNHLLCIADIEGEVFGLAPHCQVSDMLLIGSLNIVSDEAYHVVSSANLMMVLESCTATHS
jgi:hypothetical protein